MVADAMLPGLLTEFRAQDITSHLRHYGHHFWKRLTEAAKQQDSLCNAQHASLSLGHSWNSCKVKGQERFRVRSRRPAGYADGDGL
jgi:hypothetical protein